ncbi:FtsX-like permease family protein [Spirosoma sp. HMF4905]|uniref:FtsX-like permease family protein n=1 Tax=Spirosoma arboris TaxID=2682092 RepID=A0A7K1SD93_9BACT|nr:FtsX-like permease family protein [Spirosoma arboris]MVM31760.1 FtsX-like permease family protein [Spirosoma arboris]
MTQSGPAREFHRLSSQSHIKYHWLAGSPVTALQEPFKVVLTESQAHKYFESQPLSAILGKTIQYQDVLFDSTLVLTVSGIVKDFEKQTDFTFTDFISFPTVRQSFLKKEIQLDNWGNWNPNAQGFAKLAIGQNPGQVEKQFPQFLSRHVPPYSGFTTTLTLQPLSDLHFDSNYRDNYSRKAHRPTLYGLMGIAAFSLLIAIINFITLSTAQSIGRAKEIGVRKALGSNRTSLIGQFLVETWLLTLLVGGLSIALTLPVIYAFPDMIPPGVSSGLLSPTTIAFLLSVILMTSLVAGYYPATIIASYSPVNSLKGRGVGKLNNKSYFRKSLIVFQFVISLIFMACTFIAGNQIRFIMNKDLGFEHDAIVTFYTAWSNPQDRSGVFAERIRQLPSVRQVSTHLETPAAKRHAQTYIRYVDVANAKVGAAYELADDQYVPLFGLTILAGRNLSSANRPGEFLINQTCSRELGFRTPADAIGKLVQTGMDEATGVVVGVVKDFHANSLHERIEPFFFSSNQNSERAISVKLATREGGLDQFGAQIARIEANWKEIYPHETFQYHFFDQTIARLYEREQKTLRLLKRP